MYPHVFIIATPHVRLVCGCCCNDGLNTNLAIGCQAAACDIEVYMCTADNSSH